MDCTTGSALCDSVNAFYDEQAVALYELGGGCMPPSPFDKRTVVCASVRCRDELDAAFCVH